MTALARGAGIYSGFNPVILSDEVGIVKPDVSIYRLALSGLHLPAEECIFVDDLSKNLEPANALGMKTVLATHETERTITELRSLIG